MPGLPGGGDATNGGEEILARTLTTRRFNTTLLTLFAALALTLAAVGLYGVTSQTVRRRRGEIGVRLALGARRRQIFRLVLGEGLRLTGLGLGVGLAGAAVLTRFLETLLFEVGAFDPVTFLLVPGLLVATTCLALYVPARRATDVDPAVSLRSD